MGNQYKQGRQQRRQGGQERKGPSHQELSNLYGELVFTPLEVMVKELSGKGIVLEFGDFGHVKELVGDDFAGRVQDLRQAINDGIPQEHKGAYDGWAKQVINDSFAEGEVDNAFFLVLPGQARKHQFIQDVTAFVMKYVPGVKLAAETKINVKAVLGHTAGLVQKLEAEIDAKFPEPKREGFPSMGDYLKAKASVRAERDKAKQELGEMKGKISWLNNWVEGKPRPGKPGADTPATKSKSPIEAKNAEIEAIKAKISELQSDESRMAGLKNYAKAGEYATEWQVLQNTELPRLEKELEELIQAGELKARVEAAAQVVAGSPAQATGKFAAPEIGAAVAQVVAGGKPVVDLQAEITRLELEVTNQIAAVERHEAEALLLRSKVAEVAFKDANAAIVLLQQVRAEAEAAKTARGLAEKWDAELAELRDEAEEEMAKAVASEPAATPSVQPPTLAGGTATNDDDPVTFLEVYLENNVDPDPEVTKSVAGLLEAVKFAIGKGKGAKRIAKALARFQSEEVDVNAVIADTEAILAIAR